jgi:bifunctional enzyme CysN/CysC/sulfate adenylyltransferase subunit 1
LKVVNIALLGHKDHGKSTLIGNLLIKTGAATQVRMKEAEHYSKKLHKQFEPAFILDSFSEEREGGMTYDTTRGEIKYKDIAFALIDVPGHEELIKNMISGASYGEIALLLVSAKKSEGINDQTKRHLFIAKMMGIDYLVVAVNKMDTVGYLREPFESIKEELMDFITKIGFDRSNVSFVPVSAYIGDNLVKRSGNMRWYRGRHLLELLYENSKHKGAKDDGALRITLQGLLNDRKDLVAGRIVRGHIKVGEKGTCIVPLNVNVSVKGIIVKGKRVKSARVGESVALELDKEVNKDPRGAIICGESYCPIARARINARIFVTGRLNGRLSIRFNGMEVECSSIKMASQIDTTTGEPIGNKRVKALNAIDAELELVKKIPAESFAETRELGRFVLYSGKEFAGIGIVK